MFWRFFLRRFTKCDQLPVSKQFGASRTGDALRFRFIREDSWTEMRQKKVAKIGTLHDLLLFSSVTNGRLRLGSHQL